MGIKNIIGELQVNGSPVVTEDTLGETSGFSGSYNDLTNKPTIPDALSDLTDDSTHRTVTDTEKATWNAKSNFSGSYNDLTNKPTTVPSYTADNNGQFLRVINGAVTWATVSNAEEATF